LILSTLFSFLGGSAFRMIWGEVSSWLNKKQDHEQEMERMRWQAEADEKAHLRNTELIRLQAELKVEQVMVQSEADQAARAADAFTVAMEGAFKPTGYALVDVWNGVIRPSFATICLLIWGSKIVGQGFIMDDFDKELLAGIVGFFFADRTLGKRGK